ncbi:MAG: DUF2336 domain-containing protein [Rhodospirillales bacterium]
MDLTYDEAKSIAQDGDEPARKALALCEDIAPELLYYLAQDTQPAVRLAIAANKAAPMHADLLLARDDDEAVRARLAEKISSPETVGDDYASTRLRDMAHEALMLLARDQAVRVRQTIAEALKELANAPANVIRRLAWDVESVVATPILKYSPVLSDHDLIEIILAKPSTGAILAVSERIGVSEDVSHAIISTADIEAVALLLANDSAQIREETLDMVIADASRIDLWHMPLAMRPRIPSRMAVKIARVVAEDVLRRMQTREDLPGDVAIAVRAIVLERLGDGAASLPVEGGVGSANGGGVSLDDDNIFDRAAKEWAAGTLDEAALVDALTRGDTMFAKAIISVMADVPFRKAGRVFDAHNAKACVALAWRAGISAETTEIMQEILCGIAPDEILRAKDGSYALTENDLIWQIDIILSPA